MADSEREARDNEETEDYRSGRSHDGLRAKFRMLAMWTEECEKMICEIGGTAWKPTARLLDAYRLLGVPATGFDGSATPRSTP